MSLSIILIAPPYVVALKRKKECFDSALVAIRLEPSKNDVYNKLSYYAKCFDDAEACIKYSLLALKQSSDNSSKKYILRRLGWAYEKCKNYDGAYDTYSKIMQLDPKDIYAVSDRGWLAEDHGKHDESLKDFNRYIELKPNNYHPYACRAVALTSLKRYKEALADLDKAKQLDPKQHFVYYRYAILYMDKGEFDRASTSFEKCIELNPKDIDTYKKYISMLYDRENFEKALTVADRFVETFPSYATTYSYRSSINYVIGKFDDSLSDLDKIKKLMPGVDINYKAALACLGKGNWKDALSRSESYLKSGNKKDGMKSLYARALIPWYAYSRLDRKKEAIGALESVSKQSNQYSKIWPFPIVQYLSGQMKKEELLKICKSEQDQITARSWIGIKNSIDGQKSEARSNLEWAVNKGYKSLPVTPLARALFEKM